MHDTIRRGCANEQGNSARAVLFRRIMPSRREVPASPERRLGETHYGLAQSSRLISCDEQDQQQMNCSWFLIRLSELFTDCWPIFIDIHYRDSVVLVQVQSPRRGSIVGALAPGTSMRPQRADDTSLGTSFTRCVNQIVPRPSFWDLGHSEPGWPGRRRCAQNSPCAAASPRGHVCSTGGRNRSRPDLEPWHFAIYAILVPGSIVFEVLALPQHATSAPGKKGFSHYEYVIHRAQRPAPAPGLRGPGHGAWPAHPPLAGDAGLCGRPADLAHSHRSQRPLRRNNHATSNTHIDKPRWKQRGSSCRSHSSLHSKRQQLP